MSMLSPPLRRIIFSLVVSAVALLPVGATDSCIADWSIAAPIVHAQGLTTVEALSRIAATEMPGVIVKTTLCEEKGAFVYRILVRDDRGKLINRTVDARQPFGR
ncbi:MAG: hypothetical protein ABI457_11350 [Hyphomicrobium sp.]